MDNLELLKLLLLSEAEGEEQEEVAPDQDQEEPIPGSFEDDPMSYILRKYASLNTIMEELLTPSFKEYVEAVFLVAPKPSTFKVVLHNGQMFFLTYLGKAYQATIAGRNYYLIEIGEKERCMLAISKLLRFGSPLKTKGPEGAEQGTRDEENTGMEGDWAAKGGATGGAASEEDTTADTGGGEGEEVDTTELTEDLKIIKAIIKEAEKQDPKLLLKAMMSALQNQKLNVGKIESKNGGPHIRVPMQSDLEAKKAMEEAAKFLNLGKNYSLDIIAPNQFTKGSRSGKFKTYVLTVTKDQGEFKKGMQAHIVSNVAEGKSTIAGKSFTPGNLGLTDKTFKSGTAIVKEISPTVKSKGGDELGNALVLLMNDVASQSKKKFSDISEVKDYTQTIKLSDPTKKALSTILPSDLDTIGKDFGEVLGAISIGNQVGLETGVRFPGGNEPLVDFYVDDYGISSKYKQGAAATLTKIIDQIDPKTLTSKSEKKLYNLVAPAFKGKSVSGNYLAMAKKLELPELQLIADLAKKSVEELTINDFDEVIKKILKNKLPNAEDQNADKLIKAKLDPFFKMAGTSPSFPINWGKLANKKTLYGIITSPLAYSVARTMNKDADYTKGLKQIIGKIEIKQLYLDFDLGKNTSTFHLKSFSDPNASFSFVPSNISVNNPNNGNLGFKMK
jgi:hypothetical protein